MTDSHAGRRRLRAVAASAIVAAALTAGVACGNDDDAAAPATDVATQPGPETASGTTGATAAIPIPGGPEPLPAGRYASTTFAEPLEITLDEGWQLQGPELEQVLDFARDGGAVTLGFYLPASVIDPADPDGRVSLGTPADMIAFLVDHPLLETSAPKVATIGGLSGTSVEVTVPRGIQAPECPSACAPLFRQPDGSMLALLVGDPQTATVLPIDSRQVVVISSGGPEAKERLATVEFRP